MIKVKLIFKQTDYLNDVQDIPRAFAPYMVVDENAESFFKWEYNYSDGIFHVSVSSDLWEAYTDSIKVSDADFVEYKRETKFFLKTVLYRYLSEHLQIRLPYGSLTGVRPTKMYYELSEKSEHPEAKLIEKYDVLPKKAELIADCVKNQKNYINRDPKGVALFLNIPFCPTRCKYCSFISTEVSRVRKELPLYVECVKKEWDGIFEIIAKNGYNVKSVYVGGGTPTSVGSVYLDAMIAPLKNFGVEFTVEAGRPDTISEEILGVLQNNGVTRISVNPQTFKNSTLELIGRRHTVEDVYRCFEMVRSFGFHFDVNADLIATLPEETYGDFVHSVDECIALSPENITIHTLSLKRGSVFTVSGMEKEKFGLAEKMTDYAHETLKKHGYVPYYMYRQKNTADNLENTGYTLPSHQCSYNIDMMEESASVIAAGAGGMSKTVNGGKIERFSDPKGFREYCDRIDGTIASKNNFFLGKCGG